MGPLKFRSATRFYEEENYFTIAPKVLMKITIATEQFFQIIFGVTIWLPLFL